LGRVSDTKIPRFIPHTKPTPPDESDTTGRTQQRFSDQSGTSPTVCSHLIIPRSWVRSPPALRWKRYEKPLPGHRVQVDVKFIEPIAGLKKRHYQYTAIDDCTRIRVLRIYPKNDQKTAIQFLDYFLERLPFKVEVIQTDNGAEFRGAFHYHVLDKGIGHVYIKPATPRLNGKVERSHRIDNEEFYRQLEGVVIDDTGLFNEKLREWEDFYNFNRPHGGLGGQTPYERLKQKVTNRV
jgi:transposase InsO family protein